MHFHVFGLVVLVLVYNNPAVLASDPPSVSRQVLDRAIQFLLDQRDPVNLSWKPKEAPSAFLGISSADPTWRLRGTTTRDLEKRTEVVATVQGVQLAFLKLVSGPEGINAVDDSLLTQFVGAFQLACLDITKIYGYDLAAEMANRLNKQFPVSVSLGPLVLGLCSNGKKVSPRVIHFLKHFVHENPDKRRDYQLYELERACLNLVALKCLKDDDRYQSPDEKKRIDEAYQSNLGFIQSLEVGDNGYGTLYKTSLALQALGHGGPYEQELRDQLISLQKPDGSFGGSVVVTALVIPAISNFSAQDIKDAPCSRPTILDTTDKDFVRINYEITENIVSKQSVVGQILAKPGGNLDEAFKAYQKENPLVLDYESESTPFGKVIRQINGIERRDNLQWYIYKVDPETEQEQKLTLGLEDIKYEDGDTYHMKYDL